VSARHVRLVIEREALDYRRQKRVWRRLFLQPLLFIAVLSVPVLLVQQAQSREQDREVTVAVQGDAIDVPGLVDALTKPPLHYRPSTDAARDVVGSAAEVGLVLAPSTKAAVERGTPVPVQLLTLPTETGSRLGGGTVAQRLAELRAATVNAATAARGLPPSVANPISLTPKDLATTTATGTRFGLAQGLPALLVIQLFGLMSNAEERIAGAKDRRVLEPLLVLPFRRRDIVLGIGGASLGIGFLAAALVFVPLALGLATFVGSVAKTVGGSFDVVSAILVGAILLGTFFTSFGLYAGARAHSGGEGSTFVTVAQVAVFAVVASTPFLSELAAKGPILAAPVIGPMLLIREGAASGLDTTQLVTAIAGALVVARLLVDRATRLVGAEVSVLRASK
jgi:ABC-type Na+ efflux pump permease subunit